MAFSNATMERVNQDMISMLAGNLQPPDIVLWNTGIHHTKTFGGNLDHMFSFVNNTFVKWTANKEVLQLPSLWWRESYPQHFKTGEWSPETIGSNGKHCHDISKIAIVNTSGYFNEKLKTVLEYFDVPVLRVYQSAVPLHWAHYNPRRDCTHFCTGEYGPTVHDHAFLTALIQAAQKFEKLPPLLSRTRSNAFKIRERWHHLMEDDVRSVIAQMEVCAHQKFCWKGKLPASLKTCVCSSFLAKYRKYYFPPPAEYRRLNCRPGGTK